MLLVECNGCRTKAFVDCTPECQEIAGAHHPACPGGDLDAQVTCPPDSGCCQEDHDHTQTFEATGAACRPVTITVMPGSTVLTPVTGA